MAERSTTPVLIFGAGNAGRDTLEHLSASGSRLVPVAFLDDNPLIQGRERGGLRIVGTRHEIAEKAAELGAEVLIIAMPSATTENTARIAAIGREAGLRVEILAPYSESLSDLLLTHATDQDYLEIGEQPTDAEHFDLAIIGLGYVGLPVAIEAARAGLKVLGLDIDSERIGGLTDGLSHIEDITDLSVTEALENGFVPTTDASKLAGADVISISVPTPLKDKLPDLGAVIDATNAIGSVLRPGQLVILESTTYPGTTEEVVIPILEERSGLTAGQDFLVAFSPERIDPGNPQWTINNTPKVIGGHTPEAAERAAEMYGRFCDELVPVKGTREAEMAKLLENTYRHVNIALINELAIFCRPLGVDIWEVIRAAATKPFGFQAFYPGPGVGGHCIPIDPGYLSFRVQQLGEQFQFVELASEINDYMPEHVARRAQAILDEDGVAIAGAEILVLGVAYKEGVSDVRETPASSVISHLRNGGAKVIYADPLVERFEVGTQEVPRAHSPVEAAASADLVIIHTPHAEFDLDAIVSACKRILDTRGIVPEAHGL